MFLIRRCFTLMELLVVIAILLLVMGVIGINVGSAVRTEKFNSGVGILVDKLRMAQDIMLILKTNVKVKLEQGDKGLVVSVNVDRALSPVLKQAVIQKTTIEEIRSFSFTAGEMTDNEKVTLDFMSGGSRMTKGKLTVKSGNLSEDIYLSGYPQMIQAGKKDPLDKVTPEMILDLYPSAVTAQELKRKEENEQKNKK